MMPRSPKSNRTSLVLTLLLTGIFRLVLNTARRFAYPYASELSRGLAVPLPMISAMIAANQASGLLGLLFGPLGDRVGYRRLMLAGLALLATGMSCAALVPSYGTVILALFLAGLGKNLFDPAIQAYVGARVTYARRSTAIALIETSWAGSTLIGIPLVGLLMTWGGWQSPFSAFALLGWLGFFWLWRRLPIEDPFSAHRAAPLSVLRDAWQHLRNDSAARIMLTLGLLTSTANDALFVIYGVWLEQRFGLSLVQIGLGTVAIGAAELGGEFMTALLADRYGKKRVLVLGLALGALGYLLLPWFGVRLVPALAWLFFIFLSVEFTIVTAISLATEVMPDHRGTMMAAFLAAAGLGRMAGALSGGLLWNAGGIVMVSLVAAGLNATALATTGLYFKERQP